MCKVRDVALAILDKSIKLSQLKGTSDYQMDYVKLHKLLYLGQCMMLAKHDLTLFEESVTAHHCGPYVEGLHFVVAKYGFDEIRWLANANGETPDIWQLPFLRDKIVDELLERYGRYTTDQIVKLTKETSAYASLEDYLDEHPEISKKAMKTVGFDLQNWRN